MDDAVRAAAEVFRGLGASVAQVSLPMHGLGPAIWLAIAAEGATGQMMKGDSHGLNWRGLYLTGMMEHHARWRERADALPDTVKVTLLLGEYLNRNYGGRYYGKAQNLARQLRLAYDGLFEDYDLLLMPTLPLRATPLPAADAPLPEVLDRAFEMLGITESGAGCPWTAYRLKSLRSRISYSARRIDVGEKHLCLSGIQIKTRCSKNGPC